MALLLTAGAVAGFRRGADDASTPPAAAAAPTFVDDTAGSGVEHAYRGGFEHFVGGGVAVLDCDDDGRAARYAGHVAAALSDLSASGHPPAAFLAECVLSCGGQVEPPGGYFMAAYGHAREAGQPESDEHVEQRNEGIPRD